MSIFSTILQKLGIQKPAAPAAATAPAKPAAFATPQTSNYTAPKPVTPAVAAIPVVDVMSKLDNLAGEQSGLDWKVSIVDLLKLLGIDSSFSARKELATELGCPADLMSDSAKMNTWLHKTVLQKIAENGGNIPESLLH
ncbi:MAG: DUF3597 domain-containing protein [Chloroflexi bacterium]|nr:DUF3597 domain-containing protein [Chloroflexota bacterium]